MTSADKYSPDSCGKVLVFFFYTFWIHIFTKVNVSPRILSPGQSLLPVSAVLSSKNVGKELQLVVYGLIYGG